MKKSILIPIIACLGFFHKQVLFAAESQDGLQFMKDVIYQFETMRGELVDDFSQENRKKVSQKAKKLALKILDVNEIGRLSLGKYANKITKKQKDEFFRLFHDLMAGRVVEANIPNKKILSSKIPIHIMTSETVKDRIFQKQAIVVKTRVPHKRINYFVDFYLFETKEGLKLYDIHIDGASTLLDFRNQFARIIRKKGMNYLINRLRQRLKQLQNQ